MHEVGSPRRHNCFVDSTPSLSAQLAILHSVFLHDTGNDLEKGRSGFNVCSHLGACTKRYPGGTMKTPSGMQVMAPVVSNKLGEPMALFAVPLPSPGTNEFLCLCKRLFWNVGTSYFSAFCPLTAEETKVLPHSTAIVQLVSVTPAFPAIGNQQLAKELLAYTLSGDLVGIPYVAISKNNLPNGKLTKAFPFDDLKSSAWVPALNAPFVGARTANDAPHSAQNVFIIRNDEKTRQSLLNGENVTFSEDGKLCTCTSAGKEHVNAPLKKCLATDNEAHRSENESNKVSCNALKVVSPSNLNEEHFHTSLPIETESTTGLATTPKTPQRNTEQGTMILPRIESVFSLADSSPEESLSKKIADTLVKQAACHQGGNSRRSSFDRDLMPKVDSSTQQTESNPPLECGKQISITETPKTSLDNIVIKTEKELLQNQKNPVSVSDTPVKPFHLKQSNVRKPRESNLHDYFTKVSSGKCTPRCDNEKSPNQSSRVPTSQYASNQLTKPLQMQQSKTSTRRECDIQNYFTKAYFDESTPHSELERSQSQNGPLLCPQLVRNQPTKTYQVPGCGEQQYTKMSQVEDVQTNSASPRIPKNKLLLFTTMSPERNMQMLQSTANLGEKTSLGESSHTYGKSSTCPNQSASSFSSKVKTSTNTKALTYTKHTKPKRNHSQGKTVRKLLELKTGSDIQPSGYKVLSAHSVFEPSRTENTHDTNRSSPSSNPLTSKDLDEKPKVVQPKEISDNILTGDPSKGSRGHWATGTLSEANSVNAPPLKMVFKAGKGGSYRVQNAPQPANKTLVIFNGRFPCIHLHKLDINKYMSARNTPEIYREDKVVFNSGNQRMQYTEANVEKTVVKEEATDLAQSDASTQSYLEVGAIKEGNRQPSRKRKYSLCRTECETGSLVYHLANVHVKQLNVETSERVQLSDSQNQLFRRSKRNRKQRMPALNVSAFLDSLKVEEGGIPVGIWEPCDANGNFMYEGNDCVENADEFHKEKRRRGECTESDSDWEVPVKETGEVDSDWDSSLEDD